VSLPADPHPHIGVPPLIATLVRVRLCSP
jgi:hypothetical protein